MTSVAAPVWGYRVELDGQPIYFGIGAEKRWEHVTSGRSHNRVLRGLARTKSHRLAVIPTNRPFNCRADARQWERDMIAFFGRWDLGRGRLVNHTDGGDGGSSEDMRRERARRRAEGWTMPEHQRRMVAARNREAMLALAKTERFWMRDTGKKQSAARKIAANRVANGTCLSFVPPWRNHNASGSSKWFWANAERIITMKAEGQTRRQISAKLGLKCSHMPWETLRKKQQGGWISARDIDWVEWARAYRASIPIGEHTHGTDPSGS